MGFGIWCPLRGSISIEKDNIYDIRFFHISSQMKCTPISHKVVGLANCYFYALFLPGWNSSLLNLSSTWFFFFLVIIQRQIQTSWTISLLNSILGWNSILTNSNSKNSLHNYLTSATCYSPKHFLKSYYLANFAKVLHMVLKTDTVKQPEKHMVPYFLPSLIGFWLVLGNFLPDQIGIN